jgi:hypothetical protein
MMMMMMMTTTVIYRKSFPIISITPANVANAAGEQDTPSSEN